MTKGCPQIDLPVSMNDGIEGESVPPTRSEVRDSDSRIAFSGSLSPSKESLSECNAVVVLNDVRNLLRERNKIQSINGESGK